MDQQPIQSDVYTRRFIEQNFTALRNAALRDLTCYVSAWSIYTVKFLNSVAEIQGLSMRVSDDAIQTLRTGQKRVRDLRLAKLLQDAKDPGSMDIVQVMEVIASRVAARKRAQCNKLPRSRRKPSSLKTLH